MVELRQLTVERVRHALKFRILEVVRVQALSPHLVRVTLAGEDLAGFVSASFDDHVKLFFPAPGETKPPIPQQGPNGSVFPEGKRPVARDFTPRRYDPLAGELDLEFVLGHAGPASLWAADARPGLYLGIGGPRGSFVIPRDFDGHLLIGDETAFPAIGRRLEELPAGVSASVIVVANDASERIVFSTAARLRETWVYRREGQAGDPLVEAVRAAALPEGEGYVWAAGEASSIRAARHVLVHERGWDRTRIRASAYWRQGAVAVHENIED